jgi:dienelactone hydrolase
MATMRRLLKRALLAIAAVLLGLAALLIGFKLWCDARAFRGYDPGSPLAAEVVDRGSLPGGRGESIEISGIDGERIPFQLLLPSDRPAPYPCVVFLYGIGQRMSFFDQIAPLFAERGFALAVPEQHNRGVRRQARGKAEAIHFHQRCSRIVPETRRLVDYLLQRKDIDPDRLDLLGASYGGIMGCAAMRHEPRFRSAVFSLAGGGIPDLANHFAKQSDLGQVAAPLAALASWWLSPFEPLSHVGRIAPRPLLFLNLEEDEIIPRRCTEALFTAANEPKSQNWIKASHIDIDEFLVRSLVSSSLDWLEAQDPK